MRQQSALNSWLCSERPEKRRKADKATTVQPVDIDFDADITPEEMQMMQSMGMPFVFDTTQVCAPMRYAVRLVCRHGCEIMSDAEGRVCDARLLA